MFSESTPTFDELTLKFSNQNNNERGWTIVLCCDLINNCIYFVICVCIYHNAVRNTIYVIILLYIMSLNLQIESKT